MPVSLSSSNSEYIGGGGGGARLPGAVGGFGFCPPIRWLPVCHRKSEWRVCVVDVGDGALQEKFPPPKVCLLLLEQGALSTTTTNECIAVPFMLA